jgi:hypothetical protein
MLACFGSASLSTARLVFLGYLPQKQGVLSSFIFWGLSTVRLTRFRWLGSKPDKERKEADILPKS